MPLATVALNADGTLGDITTCAYRPVVYSNAVLFDLILCLAARVDHCCAQGTPPVVRAIWPPNAARLAPSGHLVWFREWEGAPRLEVTFDRDMAGNDLRHPDRWLGSCRPRAGVGAA